MKLQRVGSYAVIAAAIAGVVAYIACVALVVSIQPSSDWDDPAKTMVAISSAPVKFYLYTLLWIASNILFLPIVLAIRERIQANAPHLTSAMLIAMSVALAMATAESLICLKSVGIIISQKDISAFRACWAVIKGLHWANGHAYGWASLLLGCAVLKTRVFSRLLGGLLLLTGILWIPNFFFVQLGFTRITLIYTSTACISAGWLGVALLRQKQPQSAGKGMAASR
jgi:hypothetical protein